MKTLVSVLLLLPALVACQKSDEEKVQAQVAEEVRTHFTHGNDYRPQTFRSRPYTRYDSLVYRARTAVLNATALSPVAGAALALPPRRAADSVRIGTLVAHTYATSGGHGVARRDSTEYVVYKSGELHEVLPDYVMQARLRRLGQ